MPRKPNSSTAKATSRKQSKRQMQARSSQFGELETTPTSHHEESAVQPARQRKRAIHSDDHHTVQSVELDEYDDGIDDFDLAKLADTPRANVPCPRDGEIAWSERDSETHRSSSMSSQEEQQLGQVFRYIGEDTTFTSPTSGHGALPDTLPLPAATGDLPLADCQSQPSQHVDFSETASTVFRSSPFGRSHISRKSVTTPQPASNREEPALDLLGTQPPEPGLLGKEIPPPTAGSDRRFETDLARDPLARTLPEGTQQIECAPLSPCGENTQAESCHTGRTLALGDLLLDHMMSNRLEDNAEIKPIASAISHDTRSKKKRKQRPKTPIQFDENTQKVKSLSQQPSYRKLCERSLGKEQIVVIQEKSAHSKKRKTNVSNGKNSRKKTKSTILSCSQSPVLNINPDTRCSSEISSSASQPPLKDRPRDEEPRDSMEGQTDRSQVVNYEPLEENCIDRFATTCVAAVPSILSHTRTEVSPVQIAESTKTFDDCILVKTDQRDAEEEIDEGREILGHPAASGCHGERHQSRDVHDDKCICVSIEGGKKMDLDVDAATLIGSSSRLNNVHVSRHRLLPGTSGSHITDGRMNRNFSVSERGSPIPWQQHEDRVKISSARYSNITSLTESTPKMIHSPPAVQKRSQGGRMQQVDEWAAADDNPELIDQVDVFQQSNHPELRPSILSDIKITTSRRAGIQMTDHAAQSVTAIDRSRQQLHELVNIFMVRFDSKGADILAVADGYKRVGDRCVEKIQSRFFRERSVIFDDATNHAKRFHRLASKGVRVVNSNCEKGSELLQSLRQTILQRSSLYEHASVTLQSLHEKLMTDKLSEVQNSCAR
ncbi:hypothetical protein NOR_01740 [Metarhizium rileyi]|uniref:Uncharacterized protein n=1 Tax=Metarhizium rileyi (strain RCEF 4871) TaxID=1649241 RepID=A0A162M0Z2_METRR|nr:hypothetical protein NOR_01740 [Metarhizium rileyi RCEF 4871]